MGITTVKLVSQKLLMKKNPVWMGLYQFMLSCQILLIHKKYGHIQLKFSFILCNINFKDYLDKYPNIHIIQII